ncbi:hypothetical protein GR183_12810 [Stappia sp. GBMRC 2046]|uniref:Bacterial transcriptional activator domain-containing protein n=1 Tax=Stappia sediminis TaxID=2692190 RepID=A0A7X3S8H2_9HYPH|nr:BTAD domain-containing putative transcriptional regulator [Stappia sediminis]MXN65789.1 hypothetical protein [Stappia sediminis]
MPRDERNGAGLAGGGAELQATLFGLPGFTVAGHALRFRSRKAEALLSYMCLTTDGRLTREMAAGLLWGESSEDRARSSLRQTLLILRRELEAAGFEGLHPDKLTIYLDKTRVATDVDALLDELAKGEKTPPSLLNEKRLPDRLLEGFEALNEESFIGWLRVRRQHLQDRLRTSLEDRLNGARDQASNQDAAIALLNLDPTHEPACRALMNARAASGDFAGAVRAYEDLWRVLDEEFDTQPSERTQALVVNIKLERYPQSTEAAGRAEAGFAEREKPAVSQAGGAQRISPWPGEVWPVIIVEQVLQLDEPARSIRMAQVFRHDLISRLVRFREWSVVEAETEELVRSGTPVYKVSISSVSSREQASISVAVRNSRSNAYIWGRDFKLDAAQFFELQGQLVSNIAMAMNVNISAERLAQLSKVPVASLMSYDRLLKGQQLHYTWKLEDSHRAQAILEAIIEQDPQFGPAYCTLAQILNSRHIIFPGQPRTAQNIARATELARTAIGLDPFDSRAYLCAGWTLALQGNYEAAEEQHRLALDLNNNDPWTVLSVAHAFAFYGRREEATVLARQLHDAGMLTSPIYWSYFIGVMFLCGDYGAVLEAFPHFSAGYPGVEAWYIAALAHTGDLQGARKCLSTMESYLVSRWTGADEPTREEIAHWLGQCFPLNDREGWQRLREGLRLAGMDFPPFAARGSLIAN